MNSTNKNKINWEIFFHSVFFVLGFSAVFSLLGVLLQSVLSNVAFTVQKWLGYFSGALIIIFGLYLLGLIKISFLEKEYKIKIKKNRKYSYATSFVFGSAYAVGWTPCVGAVLGTILTLAVLNPSSAFKFLFSYSIGLGIPFLLIGLFAARSQILIERIGTKLRYLNYIFGIFLIILGILIFTSSLRLLANIPYLSNVLINISTGGIRFEGIGIGVAFIAGLVSFLSPCCLPLIPGFLSYLATTATNSATPKINEA